MLFVHCQFVTVLIWQGCKACKATAAAAIKKSFWFLCGRTSGCSVSYRSRRVKARRPSGWQEERDIPRQVREWLSWIAESQGRTLQHLFWRWSQAVQLPLIQAFPVLKVVVQVLHKIGKICKSWRDSKGWWSYGTCEAKSLVLLQNILKFYFIIFYLITLVAIFCVHYWVYWRQSSGFFNTLL